MLRIDQNSSSFQISVHDLEWHGQPVDGSPTGVSGSYSIFLLSWAVHFSVDDLV